MISRKDNSGGISMIFGRWAAMMVVMALLTACATGEAKYPPSPLAGSNLTGLLDGKKAQGLADPFIRAGLQALEDGDYVAAQAGFNRALKFDPTNSQIHFLNGLTYHLRAAAGDSSQKEYAAIGYRLALQYDSANYWAAYQLGHINFNDQRFREAQDAFAYALLFAPEEPVLLKALATASYYAQDLETAAGAIGKAEKLAPADTQVLRMAALVNAAGTNFDDAERYLSRYREGGNKVGLRRVGYLAKRIGDWRNFHGRGGFQLVQSTSDILGDTDTSTGLAAPSGGDSGNGGNGDSGNGDADSSSGKKKSPPRMTMVDVVIIRSEERRATGKGVNLLSGLSTQLTGTVFSATGTRTLNSGSATADTDVRVFTYSPTLAFSTITYALNIFNDNNDHNEVLARPSLVALDGKKSEFFTGAVFHVEIQGVSGSEGSVEDVPVGIKLDVTPKFLGKDTVQLKVSVARAFIEARSPNAGFNNFSQVTKTIITANVVMKFGDTLVLSGLSEKETEDLHDGVPLLQDIPGLQYFFSREDTLDFTKSVLILLTPRLPLYTHADGSAKVDRSKPADAQTKLPNLDELKGRPDWFKPAANLDAVFQHLKDRRLFKEFRAGDVRLETWEDQIGLGLRIKRAVDFLYF